jgi:hypothetical protein
MLPFTKMQYYSIILILTKMVTLTAIGRGASPFQALTLYQPLTLVNARTFDCGVAVMHYTLPRA